MAPVATDTTRTDLRSETDEANASVGAYVEVGRIRDGEVVVDQQIFVPEEYYQTAANAVVEQLTLARHSVLREVPRTEADALVSRFIHDGVIRREDAKHVRDAVEVEIRRAVEALATDARDRFNRRLPLVLRSLIPLIVRKRGPVR